MPSSASSTQIQTRRSGRIAGLKGEGNVGLKRPAEVIAARARRKVDDEGQQEEITRIQILIQSEDDENPALLNFELDKRCVGKVEEVCDTTEGATELERTGTPPQEAQGAGPAKIISWAAFTKSSCSSIPIYENPYPCDHDTMVVPTGPKRQNSIHPRATPTQPQKRYERFDLTSENVRGGEPDAKRQRLNSDLGFPARLGSQDTGAGAYDRHSGVLPKNEPRSAGSSANPEHRTGDKLAGLQTSNEYKNLEKMMSSNPGRRRQSQHDSRGTSRQNTHEISDDESIQDDGPDVKPQRKPESGGYEGTAGLMPARSREGRAAANKPKRRPMNSGASSYFTQQDGPAYMGLQGLVVGGGSAASTPRMKDRMQHEVGKKRPSIDIEDISDDDGSAKKPRRGSNTGEVRSGSLSQAGDIKPSFLMRKGSMFKKQSEIDAERINAKFPVSYVKSREESYYHSAGQPAQLMWSGTRKTLNIVDHGKELNPSLVIDPERIVKVSCVTRDIMDGRFFINQSQPMTPLLLIALYEPGQQEPFLEFLKSLGSFKIDRVAGDKMEAIFQNTNKKLDACHRRPKCESPVTSHQYQELLEHTKGSQQNMSLLQRSQTNGEDGAPAPRKKLVNSLTREMRITESRPASRERPAILPADELGRPATRSTRSQHIQLHRSSSPRPELWTDANRGWREKYWKGDEPLIFPENGDKRATVDRQDIVRLNELEFLNDNLLQFYLRYLEEKIKTESPDVAKRVLFMNPFFYQRLTKGKGRSNIDYDGVKRWTSKFDIFKFDYVIVPVNEHAHWYLAVICNTPAFLKPPEEEEVKADENDASEADASLLEVDTDLATAEKKAEADSTTDVEEKVGSMTIDESDTIRVAEDETATKGPVIPPKQKKKKKRSLVPRRYKTNEPRIITMDSLGYPHSPTCSHLRDFLVAEAKARHSVDVPREKPVGMTAKNIPEQNNHCDCGLFLLGYVEHFLQDPDGMMHDLMQQKPEVIGRFAKLDAHKMRNDIRQLLFNLKKEQTDKQQAEKQAKIAKRRAKEASEAGDSLPTTTEPTPAASPERAGATSSDDQSGVALNASQKTLIEPMEEESIIEVEKPATPAAMKTEKRSPSEDSGFISLIDHLAGYDRQNPEVQRQNLPNSQSVEYIAVRPRDAPLPAPSLKREHHPTSKSVEYMGETRSSPAGSGSEFTARNAMKSSDRIRHPASLPSSSDEESGPKVTMETSLKKETPLKKGSTMSPIPAPSAFKGPGQKVGKIGPSRATRGPSSDLDAPRKPSVVDLEEESDDLPSQPTSRELRTRPKESLPPNQQHTPFRKSTTPARKPATKAKEEHEGTPVPVKLFKQTPPKPRLSERIATVKRSQSQTQTKNEAGATHIKFGDDEDADMLMNGNKDDSSQDSLMRGMSPEILRSSAKKLAVEIPPDASSQVRFDAPKTLFGSPNLPMRSVTPPLKQNSVKSSPSQPVRSSPRTAGRGARRSLMQDDPIMRPQPILPPKKQSSVAASSPSQPRSRILPPTNKHYRPPGSSRQSSKTPDDGKGGAAEPIELD